MLSIVCKDYVLDTVSNSASKNTDNLSYSSINVWSLVMVIVCLHFRTVISTSHRRRRFGPARKLISLNSPAIRPFSKLK